MPSGCFHSLVSSFFPVVKFLSRKTECQKKVSPGPVVSSLSCFSRPKYFLFPGATSVKEGKRNGIDTPELEEKRGLKYAFPSLKKKGSRTFCFVVLLLFRFMGRRNEESRKNLFDPPVHTPCCCGKSSNRVFCIFLSSGANALCW